MIVVKEKDLVRSLNWNRIAVQGVVTWFRAPRTPFRSLTISLPSNTFTRRTHQRRGALSAQKHSFSNDSQEILSIPDKRCHFPALGSVTGS